MKKIAIKPHKTRGIELIKILERMGGHNSHHLDGFSFRDDTAYLINENGIITSYTEHLCHEKGYKIYTLEEWEDEYKSDEMIEGLVEEETKPKYEDEVSGEYYSTPKYLVRPNGYQFVDENGNVINATKIILEKKKYPKTYEECCKILGLNSEIIDSELLFYYPLKCEDYTTIRLPEMEKFEKFIQLYLCRNAYWKIAGEEMGLGKPWEPDFTDKYSKSYVITAASGIIHTTWANKRNYVLAFPTEEMRDAFYENFRKEIESCKELL